MNNQSHPAVSTTTDTRPDPADIKPITQKELCFQLLSVGYTMAIFFCRIEPIFITCKMQLFRDPFTSPVALHLAD